MNIKQIMKSFSLEGKITEVHAKEIEDTLTEALKERDELLEEAENIMSMLPPNIMSASIENWLPRYQLLDKE